MKKFEGRAGNGWLGAGLTTLLLVATINLGQAGNREDRDRELHELRRAEPAPAVGAPAVTNAPAHGHTVFFVTNSETKLSRQEQRSEKQTAQPRERKKLILYHFNSRLGEVSVQPVFGPVNGAQLSVGF